MLATEAKAPGLQVKPLRQTVLSKQWKQNDAYVQHHTWKLEGDKIVR